MTPPRTRPATTRIGVDELADITALLSVLDGFLRSPGIPELLAAHPHTTGVEHPRYDAALLIDQISFTAHALQARTSTATTAS